MGPWRESLARLSLPALVGRPPRKVCLWQVGQRSGTISEHACVPLYKCLVIIVEILINE